MVCEEGSVSNSDVEVPASNDFQAPTGRSAIQLN